MTELRAKNSSLCTEIDILKCKLASLKKSSNTEPLSVVTQVLQEALEWKRCLFNLILYSVIEASSVDVSQRIAHDRQTNSRILQSLGDVIPNNSV
ncbi:Hypothetical protein CINCED_3A025892 [Cinara cedri]|uniref:Uncharacterized protein n=1 Tax=Cinara cedri TaxID=506608 RepID=A0A5E4MZ62_9HEMI|nr:Hypothetical protein CINCED_3A025892 [Cinara cedri]